MNNKEIIEIQEEYKRYGLTENEIELLEGYAEGHDLVPVFHEGTVKFEDTQDPGDYWAVGVPGIVLWASQMNDEIITAEEHEDNPNEEKLRDLRNDEKILDDLYDRVINLEEQVC